MVLHINVDFVFLLVEKRCKVIGSLSFWVVEEHYKLLPRRNPATKFPKCARQCRLHVMSIALISSNRRGYLFHFKLILEVTSHCDNIVSWLTPQKPYLPLSMQLCMHLISAIVFFFSRSTAFTRDCDKFFRRFLQPRLWEEFVHMHLKRWCCLVHVKWKSRDLK